jgi:hypothetical protein
MAATMVLIREHAAGLTWWFFWPAAAILLWAAGGLPRVGGDGSAAAAVDDAAAGALVTQIESGLESAESLVKEGRPREAGEKLAEVCLAINRIPDHGRAVSPAILRKLVAACETLARELQFDAVVIADVPNVQEVLRRRAEQISRGVPRPPEMVPQGPRGPSFVQQVAPALVRACGRCHLQEKRGDFSLATYRQLAESGMVVPGDGLGSRLVEVIRTGDMPRGGGQFARQDFADLVSWINNGAVFDGVDSNTALDQLETPATMPPGTDETAAQSSMPSAIGPDDILFSSAIAGVLLEQCQRCHGGGNPSAGLSMDTFEELMEADVIQPGKGAESLLVRKLVGVNIDGQRMPRGRPPLPDETIATISQWIDEGASLDLPDPSWELSQIASEGRSRNLSHEELRSLRFEAASAVWQRGIVDDEGKVEERGDCCVIGNLESDRLSEVADSAAELEADLQKKLGISEPLVKGGIAVFVFARGYDFSNYWQNVVGRERPRGLLGYAGASGDVVYAAVAASHDSENNRLMLSAEMVAASLRYRGAPEWYAEGVGRCVARSLVPKAPMLAVWDDEELVARKAVPPSAEGFFKAPISTQQVAAASAMLASVDRQGSRIAGVIRRLDDNRDFDVAFRQSYRAQPEQLLLNWIGRPR